jgi:hypothetical protein
MTLIDLCPEYNDYSEKWEVQESDERGNAIEVHEFSTEEEAEKFVIAWAENLKL